MKLEVGMYIRIDGFISKIDYIKKSKNGNEYIQFKEPNGMIAHINSKLIEKASHNIIDLIEDGDVVVDNSGRKLEVNLIRVWNDEKEIICNDYNLDDSALTLHNGGIFKILTHEQFENNCFRIGDE